MSTPQHLDLVELPAADAETTRAAQTFYSAVFGWSFVAYVDTAVLYVLDLEAARDAVLEAGGSVVDPAGNELAAWSKDPEAA